MNPYANGIYVNGTKVDDLSTSPNFFSLVEQKTSQIGSLQGNQRSGATYNINYHRGFSRVV